MRKVIAFLWLPLGLGFVATAPFFILELINRPPIITDLPVALFVMMWITASIAVLTFRQVLRSGPAKPVLTAHNAVLILSLVVSIVTASIWIGLVNDQMPCFLGVPNCD